MTTARKRVLIVYSRVGGGHLSAARALAEELESTGEASTRLVDAYLECGRFPVTLFPAAYARLARNHPRVWWMAYHATDTRVDPTRALAPFLLRGLRSVIRQERPDLVVSVLPVVNGLLARAVLPAGRRLEVVLTDWHSVHRHWVARGVHHYSAPTLSARTDCIRYGAAAEYVDVVGIPVRRAFTNPLRQRASVAVDAHRFTILAMVGAEGSPRALRNIARLAQVNIKAQLVVVCGRNESLRRDVERLPARMVVRALGFVEDVPDLMRNADLLVTKAGGLTLAEAFCSGLPVIVHDVVPGQEAGNLDYVLSQQAVEFAPHADALASLVADLYRNQGARLGLAERGARLARPEAARILARNLLSRLPSG